MEQNNNAEQAWRKFAFDVFARITGWIAGPIIIALYAGRKLDEKFNTEPWLFLALVGISFIVSCLGIVNIAIKYIKKIEESAEAEKIARQEIQNKKS